jgi:hypothetical protein
VRPKAWASGFLAFAHGHHVCVVGHQPVAQHADPGAFAVGAEDIQVDAAVVVHEEHVLVVVAALGDVVRLTGQHDAGDARHDRTLPRGGRAVNA